MRNPDELRTYSDSGQPINMPTNLFIHATNVHVGGGRSLLHAVLSALPIRLGLVALLDTRMEAPLNLPECIEIRRVKPSILQRLKAEWWLARNVGPRDIVLCFGNLPPLFKLRGHVTVFVQNRYLVDGITLGNFPIKTRIRLGVERLWLSAKAVNADEFIVQTPSMKSALLLSGHLMRQPVHIRPFASISEGCRRKMNHEIDDQGHKRYDFIYIASGDPHKNHRRLIEAWCLLAEEGLFPSLCLTVSHNMSAELCTWMDKQKLEYGLKFENVGFLPQDKIVKFYAQARALIYPSLFESFGLPLIEARQAGLPVLAAELDYVRDVLDPEQSFDPDSPISIARAAKRYLRIDEPDLQLSDASAFIQTLLERQS